MEFNCRRRDNLWPHRLVASTVASTGNKGGGSGGSCLALCLVATAATLSRELKQALKGVRRSAESGKPAGLQIVAPATFKSYEDYFARKRCARKFDES